MFKDVSHDSVKVRRAREDKDYYEEILVLGDGERWLDYLSDSRGVYHYGPCVIQITAYPGGSVKVEETPGRVLPIPQEDGIHCHRMRRGEILLDPRPKPVLTSPWTGERWEVIMRVQDGELQSLSLTDIEAE